MNKNAKKYLQLAEKEIEISQCVDKYSSSYYYNKAKRDKYIEKEKKCLIEQQKLEEKMSIEDKQQVNEFYACEHFEID